MTRRAPDNSRKNQGATVQQTSNAPRTPAAPANAQQRPSDLKRVLGEPGSSFIGAANQTLGGAYWQR